MQHALRMHLMPPNFSRLRIPKDVKKGNGSDALCANDGLHPPFSGMVVHEIREKFPMHILSDHNGAIIFRPKKFRKSPSAARFCAKRF
jgi:hypothetical protein